MADRDEEAKSEATAVYKLPNGLIDVCLIYGVDEKTSGSLRLHSAGKVVMHVSIIIKIAMRIFSRSTIISNMQN